jgi:hypothetical protein
MRLICTQIILLLLNQLFNTVKKIKPVYVIRYLSIRKISTFQFLVKPAESHSVTGL